MPANKKAILSSALIIISIVLATVVDIWTDYRDTTLRRQVEVADITKLVESAIQTTISQGENFIDELAYLIVKEGGTSNMAQQRSMRIMRGICHGMSGCNSVSIISPEGTAIANTSVDGVANINVSDRAYFRVPQQTKSIYIGSAIVTRLPGHPILFTISKAIYGKDNRFLGVISIGMNTDHFTKFYQLVGSTLSPTITVFKANGDLVARTPDMPTYVGRNFFNSPLFSEHLPKAASGFYQSRSAMDGKERMAAYRAISDLELVVFAGIDTSVAYQSWHSRAERTIAIIGLALIIILGALRYCFRSFRTQHILQARNDELDQLSHTDALTGIANRRHFENILEKMSGRNAWPGSPVSLVMIDVDHFKQYNDHYGHRAGDECLRQVAIALASASQRESDVVARYGGEEFVALLCCDEMGAELVANRMRLAIASLKLPHARSAASSTVSVSIGIASTGGESTMEFRILIEAADKALYRAKKNGRNRVEGWRPKPALSVVVSR